MPSNPTVAMRVLWGVDNPSTSAADLAHLIELDPMLTARLLRIANSAYYTPCSRVTNVPRAVVTVGFSTVQALAAAATLGFDEGSGLPSRFWEHSAEVAHTAGLVARFFEVSANDAFAAGLLHDIGEAVIHRTVPDEWAVICAGTHPDTFERDELELRMLGTTHARVGERILEAWQLPRSLSSAVGAHHVAETTNSLAIVVSTASQFVSLVRGELNDAATAATYERLAAAGITQEFVERTAPTVRSDTAALAEAFR